MMNNPYVLAGALLMLPVSTWAGNAFEVTCPNFETTLRAKAFEDPLPQLVLAGDEVLYLLQQVPAASGAKYQYEDILFWNQGAEALVVLSDGVQRNCTLAEE